MGCSTDPEWMKGKVFEPRVKVIDASKLRYVPLEKFRIPKQVKEMEIVKIIGVEEDKKTIVAIIRDSGQLWKVYIDAEKGCSPVVIPVRKWQLLLYFIFPFLFYLSLFFFILCLIVW